MELAVQPTHKEVQPLKLKCTLFNSIVQQMKHVGTGSPSNSNKRCCALVQPFTIVVTPGTLLVEKVSRVELAAVQAAHKEEAAHTAQVQPLNLKLNI